MPWKEALATRNSTYSNAIDKALRPWAYTCWEVEAGSYGFVYFMEACCPFSSFAFVKIPTWLRASASAQVHKHSCQSFHIGCFYSEIWLPIFTFSIGLDTCFTKLSAVAFLLSLCQFYLLGPL